MNLSRLLTRIPQSLLNSTNNNNQNQATATTTAQVNDPRPSHYQRTRGQSQSCEDEIKKQQPYNRNAPLSNRLKSVARLKPYCIENSNVLMTVNVTKLTPGQHQIPLSSSPNWTGKAESKSYRLKWTIPENLKLEEYFGLVPDDMNRRYTKFIMPQIYYQNQQFRVLKFNKWRDWYTYHWQLSRLVDIIPDLEYNDDYVNDWNDMRNKVQHAFHTDFDASEQQYILQAIIDLQFSVPIYDKISVLKGTRDTTMQQQMEARSRLEVMLKQYGYELKDIPTGPDLSSSNFKDSNDNTPKPSRKRYVSSRLQSRMANSEEERYLEYQNQKAEQQKRDLQEHMEHEEDLYANREKVGGPFDKPEIDENELLSKLKSKGMEKQINSFVEIQDKNERHYNKLNKLNEEYTRQQQKLTEQINSNRRQLHQMRPDMQWEIPELGDLERNEIKRYQSKLKTKDLQMQTRGAASQRTKTKDIKMKEQNRRSYSNEIENEIEMETKLRDEKYHGKSGLVRYNNSNMKGSEVDERRQRRSGRSTLKTTDKERCVSVRIKTLDTEAMANQKNDQEQYFKQEMKKLQDKERQWGIKTNDKTKDGQVLIKPPMVAPVRPVAPVFSANDEVTDAELKDDLINIVNSDNELKKQKSGMVRERHQQVTTPLKKDDASELRTSVDMLKKLRTEDLDKINQILGQVGGKLDLNGIFASAGPSETESRVQAPRVGNNDGGGRQLQQQAQQNQVLVPRQAQGGAAAAAAGSGVSDAVCANVVGNNDVCANVVGNVSGQAAGVSGAATSLSS